MSVAIPDYQRRRAAIAQERAAWPQFYRAVRDAIARGFWPDAYGAQNPPPYLRPPTKFAFPAGGLAYPHHASGPEAGSRLWAWSFEDESPDTLRDRAVWFAGDNTGSPILGFHDRLRSGLTLGEAFATCEQFATHLRATFVVPIWHGKHPALPTGVWRELLAHRDPLATPRQAGLFAPLELTAAERAQRAIAQHLRPLADDVPQALAFVTGGELFDVEKLIDRVNWERARALESVALSDAIGPCAKPIQVMRWLVTRASLEGETVLDPFMGSGTTLVAAKHLGRKAIGVELSEASCRIAVERLQQAVLPLEVAP